MPIEGPDSTDDYHMLVRGRQMQRCFKSLIWFRNSPNSRKVSVGLQLVHHFLCSSAKDSGDSCKKLFVGFNHELKGAVPHGDDYIGPTLAVFLNVRLTKAAL